MGDNWIIIFDNPAGDEAEFFSGTLDEAKAYATGDHRHFNYGRTGVAIYPNAGAIWVEQKHIAQSAEIG